MRHEVAHTLVAHRYRDGVRRSCIALVCLTLALLLAAVADADDGGPRFRRTTPRAELDAVGGALVIGVPGGRAWGIESDLRPLPLPGTTLLGRLGVSDAAVREAFVRVAYYGVASGRGPPAGDLRQRAGHGWPARDGGARRGSTARGC